MCFYNEGDWCVAVQKEETLAAAAPLRCDECGVMIQVGGYVRHIHQWENEDCQDCENGDCDCGEAGCCRCPEPKNYGEEFDYHCCEQCDKFINAVASAELEVGCREHESKPMLTSLFEELHEVSIHDKRRYVKKALSMFPELRTSGYLTAMWKKIC